MGMGGPEAQQKMGSNPDPDPSPYPNPIISPHISPAISPGAAEDGYALGRPEEPHRLRAGMGVAVGVNTGVGRGL